MLCVSSILSCCLFSGFPNREDCSMKSFTLLGIRKNILLSFTLMILFFGVIYFCGFLVPKIIYPKGHMLDVYIKEIYGDLIIYVESNEYGDLDYRSMKSGLIPESTIRSLSFKDDAIFDRISVLDSVSSTMKRTFPSNDYRFSLNKISTDSRAITLSNGGEYSGIDFSLADSFYRDNKYVIYPDLNNISEGILLRDRDISDLAEKGVYIKPGDILQFYSYNGQKINRRFAGSFSAAASGDSFDGPEARAMFGLIADNNLMYELGESEVKYKNYDYAPESLSEIVFPGISDIAFGQKDKSYMGYTQILVKLKRGVSERNAIKQIEEALSEFNSEENSYSYNVASSYKNAFYETELLITNAKAENSRTLAAVLLSASFILGGICCLIYVKEQSPLLNLYYKLGRPLSLLYKDILSQLVFVIVLPGVLGGVVSLLKLEEYYYRPGTLYYPSLIWYFSIFVIIVFAVFMLTASIYIYFHLMKSGGKRNEV